MGTFTWPSTGDVNVAIVKELHLLGAALTELGLAPTTPWPVVATAAKAMPEQGVGHPSAEDDGDSRRDRCDKDPEQNH